MAGARLGAPTVQTVFVGGGTPSLLGGERLATVLESVRDNFELASDAEVTTEANPESTWPELFAGAALGRVHPDIAGHAVGGAAGAGRPRPDALAGPRR